MIPWDCIKQIGSEPETDNFELHIALTLRCQFKCVYCCLSEKRGFPHVDFDTSEDNLLRIKSIMQSIGRGISLQLRGGEPTLNKKGLIDLIHLDKYIGSDGCIAVETNLASPIEDYIDIMEQTKGCRYSFVPAFHPQFIDVEQFYSKCRVLHDYDPSGERLGVVRIMNEQGTPVSKYWSFFNSHGINASIAPIVKTSDYPNPPQLPAKIGSDYAIQMDALPCLTTDNIKFNITEYALYSDQPNLNGWECFIPNNLLYIDTDGMCFRCCTDYVTRTHSVGHLSQYVHSKVISRTCPNNRCINANPGLLRRKIQT